MLQLELLSLNSAAISNFGVIPGQSGSCFLVAVGGFVSRDAFHFEHQGTDRPRTLNSKQNTNE